MAHDSNHCLKVWRWIQRFYEYCGSGLSPERELRILEAGTLFHEQNDAKFGRNLSEVEVELREAMHLDGLLEEDIAIVLELIRHCSFKKRPFWKGNANLVGLMDLLCAGDLAEGVGEEAVDRSFEFHKNRILRKEHRIADDREVWSHVIQFMELRGGDGYMDRFEAITVSRIKEAVGVFVTRNMKRIEEIKSRN